MKHNLIHITYTQIVMYVKVNIVLLPDIYNHSSVIIFLSLPEIKAP